MHSFRDNTLFFLETKNCVSGGLTVVPPNLPTALQTNPSPQKNPNKLPNKTLQQNPVEICNYF